MIGLIYSLAGTIIALMFRALVYMLKTIYALISMIIRRISDSVQHESEAIANMRQQAKNEAPARDMRATDYDSNNELLSNFIKQKAYVEKPTSNLCNITATRRTARA